MRRAVKAWVRGGLGLALLAAVVSLADWSSVLALWQSARLEWLLAGLAAAVASNVVSAWRWRALAVWLGCGMSTAQAVRWYFQGMALNVLLPGAVVGGDVFRALALRRAGQPAREAAWSVLLDRFSGLWMLCALGTLGAVGVVRALADFLGWSPVALGGCLVAALGLCVALPWWLPGALRSTWGRRWTMAEPLARALACADAARHWRGQVLASLAVQLFSATALACGGMALGVDLGPAAWAFVIAPVFLMAALPVSVGGWGTREAAAVLAMAPFGVGAAAAVGTAMAYGVCGVLQGALGALAFGWASTEPPGARS